MTFHYQSPEMYAQNPDSCLDYEVEYEVNRDGELQLTRIVCNETGRDIFPDEVSREVWKMMTEQAERQHWQEVKEWCL